MNNASLIKFTSEGKTFIGEAYDVTVNFGTPEERKVGYIRYNYSLAPIITNEKDLGNGEYSCSLGALIALFKEGQLKIVSYSPNAQKFVARFTYQRKSDIALNDLSNDSDWVALHKPIVAETNTAKPASVVKVGKKAQDSII